MIRTLQKRTVLALLVECNGLVRLKLTRALEQEHFEVLWTTTIQEAVIAHNRRHIDLLLLDLNQPLKVRWEMFGPLEALEPPLPIVMVTEKKTELEQNVAERVGARFEKPFHLPALLQAIHELLDQPAQTHPQAAWITKFKARRSNQQLTEDQSFRRSAQPPILTASTV